MLALLNGHAGAGLGEILIAIAIGALAITVAIFWKVYRRRPSTWLRILGLLYVGVFVAHLIVAATIFQGAIILLAYLIVLGVPIAILLWLGDMLVARIES